MYLFLLVFFLNFHVYIYAGEFFLHSPRRNVPWVWTVKTKVYILVGRYALVFVLITLQMLINCSSVLVSVLMEIRSGEHIQTRVTKLIPGIRNLLDEERLRWFGYVA